MGKKARNKKIKLAQPKSNTAKRLEDQVVANHETWKRRMQSADEGIPKDYFSIDEQAAMRDVKTHLDMQSAINSADNVWDQTTIGNEDVKTHPDMQSAINSSDNILDQTTIGNEDEQMSTIRIPLRDGLHIRVGPQMETPSPVKGREANVKVYRVARSVFELMEEHNLSYKEVCRQM